MKRVDPELPIRSRKAKGKEKKGKAGDDVLEGFAESEEWLAIVTDAVEKNLKRRKEGKPPPAEAEATPDDAPQAGEKDGEEMYDKATAAEAAAASDPVNIAVYLTQGKVGGRLEVTETLEGPFSSYRHRTLQLILSIAVNGNVLLKRVNLVMKS